MSKALESSLEFLQKKADDFEARYFAAKKGDDVTFLVSSIEHYRIEAAKVRMQLLDLGDLEDHPLAKEIQKYSNGNGHATPQESTLALLDDGDESESVKQ